MKRLLIITICLALVVILSAKVKGEEPAAKPKPCEYAGIIKEKSEKGEVFTLETAQKDILSFHFKEDEKKGCLEWKDLTVGENVHVTCKQTKDSLEATCVTKSEQGCQGPNCGGVSRGGTFRN